MQGRAVALEQRLEGDAVTEGGVAGKARVTAVGTVGHGGDVPARSPCRVAASGRGARTGMTQVTVIGACGSAGSARLHL
ncbi:hypothetical protein GCM10023258_38390 [Terrabacter aeriphilus]|uniref:Uncharacterized protein n=1 Tax=Terrabacter aeriphilus TaxID=515662 RepID=A0ABP9JPY8_9MICO